MFYYYKLFIVKEHRVKYNDVHGHHAIHEIHVLNQLCEVFVVLLNLSNDLYLYPDDYHPKVVLFY